MEAKPESTEAIESISTSESELSLSGISRVISGAKNIFKELREGLRDAWNPVADAGYEYSLPFGHYEGPIDPCDDLVEDYMLMYGPQAKPPEEKVVH